MNEWFGIQFYTESQDAMEQFIHEYVLDAIERLSELDFCESISFAPAPHPDTGARTVVNLGGKADVEALIEHERDRWETFVDEGLVTDWEHSMSWSQREREQLVGKQASVLSGHLAQLSAEISKLAYDRFEEIDTFPEAVETFPEEESQTGPTGWWGVLHNTTVQLNYNLDEELAAYRYGIEHTLRNFAEYEGTDAAEERLDELIEDFEELQNEVTEGRLET